MTDASDLSARVEAILGTLSSDELQALNKSKGYAYEAYVLVAIGTELQKLGWSWVHPPKGATFARGNGEISTCARITAAT